MLPVHRNAQCGLLAASGHPNTLSLLFADGAASDSHDDGGAAPDPQSLCPWAAHDDALCSAFAVHSLAVMAIAAVEDCYARAQG